MVTDDQRSVPERVLSACTKYAKELSFIVIVTVIAATVGAVMARQSSPTQQLPPQPKATSQPTQVNTPNYSLSEAHPVNVGINSKEQQGFHASAFDDCAPPLRQGDVIWLTNESDDFAPTVRLLIDRVIPRSDNTSAGTLFVSKEAMTRLGLFKKGRPGITRLTFRKAEEDKTSTTSSKPHSPDNVVNINLPVPNLNMKSEK